MVSQVEALVRSGGSVTLSDQANLAMPVFDALRQNFPAAVAAKSVTAEQIEMAMLVGIPKFNALLLAISVGSVFFGANTYIGNGPNFMVKAIAEQQKFHALSFVGFVFRYTLPIMLPVLVVVWLVCLR